MATGAGELVRAARKAQEGYAWETSLKNYAQALETVDKLPNSGEDRFELLAAWERLLEHTDRREERAQVVRDGLITPTGAGVARG